MKAALLSFVLSISAPMHITVAALGTRVCVPVPWLVLAAEVLTAAGHGSDVEHTPGLSCLNRAMPIVFVFEAPNVGWLAGTGN